MKKYSYCVRMIFWYENLSSSYSILFTAAASVVVEELEGEEATDALSSSSSSSSSASGGKVGRVILTRRLLLPLPPLLPPADRASPSSPPPNRPPCKTARPIIFTKYCTISSTFLSIIYTIKFTIKYLQFAGVWVVNFNTEDQCSSFSINTYLLSKLGKKSWVSDTQSQITFRLYRER